MARALLAVGLLTLVMCSAGGLCPPECVCHTDRTSCSTWSAGLQNLTDLAVTNARLQHIQVFPGLRNLSKLDLSSNLLDGFPAGEFASLRVLNLSGNCFSEVGEGWLRGLESLEVLDLSHNNVSVVEDTALECIPELQTLILRNNKISLLPHFNSSLQNLDLSANNISFLNDSAFSGLENLRVINLGANRLQELNMMCFVGLANLQELDMSGNLISVLQDGVLKELASLLRLNLSGNRLQNLNDQCFQGLSQLQQLDLSKNMISVIQDGLLSELEALVRLNISWNRLESLSDQCFRGLSRLQQLDVSHNRITSVSPGTFQPMGGLTELILSDNPVLGVMVLVGTGRKLQVVDASRAGLTQVPAALTRSIRTLQLAGNLVTAVRCGDLDSYPLLQLLDLSDNRILEVEEDALGRLEVLTTLYLSGNQLLAVPRSLPAGLVSLHLQRNRIRQVNSGELQGLPRLKHLSLRDSGLSVIQNGAFSQLTALEMLDLSSNPLTSLPGNALSGPIMTVLRLSSLAAIVPSVATEMSFPVTSPERLEVLELDSSPVLARQLLADTAALAAFRQLRHLDLTNTELTSLRSDLFHFLPRLRVLKLGGNPWQCEDMLWLADWVRHEQRELQSSLRDAMCSSHHQQAAVPVLGLRDQDFNITTTSTRYDDDFTTTSNEPLDFLNITSIYYDEEDINNTDISVVTSPDVYTTTDIPTEQTSSLDLSVEISTLEFLPEETDPTDSNNTLNTILTVNTTKLPINITNKSIHPKFRVNTPSNATFVNRPWNQHKFFPSTNIKEVLPSTQPLLNSTLIQTSISNTTIFKKHIFPHKDLQKLMHQQERSFNNIMQGDESVAAPQVAIKDVFRDKTNFTKSVRNESNTKIPDNKQTQTNSSLQHEYTVTANISSSALEGENLLFENVTLAVGEKSVFYSSRASDAYVSGVRVTVKDSVSTSLISGSHPGMFVLLGVVLAMAGALAMAMSHCAKRRRRQAVEYSRQQDIEVRSMSSIGDLW